MSGGEWLENLIAEAHGWNHDRPRLSQAEAKMDKELCVCGVLLKHHRLFNSETLGPCDNYKPREKQMGYGPPIASVINDLRDEATRIAREHGFHDPDPGVPARVALIHSEASELLEDHRSGKLPNEVWYEGIRGEDMPGKPCGIPSELADIIIRCLDFAGFYDIDIGRVVMEKMRYNETRPFKHGRKL